ncbi:MAG: NAD(P)/FAD-dependent oxidoreductase, partial [Gemmatimonadota bacterium]|nr:NAD(P)/FAD-dependent oxidoreductase [Gemmatimonadota bacterium]
MKSLERCDVVVAGAGLAGLCAALQLKQRLPGISIRVVERSAVPYPEAAHKVGESSVEIGSAYLSDTLGLGDLLEREVPKLGLRLYMSQGGNERIEGRPEVGLRDFLEVPSYQIDRGRFENSLVERANDHGVQFEDEAVVRSISLARGDEEHRIEIDRLGRRRSVSCRWFLDATGRASFLRKKFNLERKNRHDVNAAWFRIDHPIEPNDWCEEPAWHRRTDHPRRLGTNHLMGPGYWVWLIPLANDRTSIGIVAEEKRHGFSELHTFERTLSWLEHHEPQLARVLEPHLDKRMDFRAIKNCAYDSKQMFSGERWCLLGESGMFLDALYSPGTDFIALANNFSTDLIARDMAGESIVDVARVYDRVFCSLARTFSATY